MAKKLTTDQAQLILRLYDLRREPEMRKARHWALTQFWPATADDCIKIQSAMGSQENAWLRQVGSYWSMAASFALHGALDEEFFLQPAISGEMVILLAKVHPFLKELRQKSGDPQSFGNIEKLVTGSKFGRERLKLSLKRVAALRDKLAK